MTEEIERLSCSETAKLVRQALKKAFTDVKFRVRSDNYSGGASIDVRWTDGPTTKAVDAVIRPFAGGSFDGSIDMMSYKTHWLMPDGTTKVAEYSGTIGSLGCHLPERNAKPHPDARKVRFGADFVFSQRSLSPAFLSGIASKVSKLYGFPVPEIRGEEDAFLVSSDFDAFALIMNEAHDTAA